MVKSPLNGYRQYEEDISDFAAGAWLSPWRWKQVDKNEQNNNIFQLQVAKE